MLNKALVSLFLIIFCGAALAKMTVTVLDKSATPLSNVVVELEPDASVNTSVMEPKVATIKQVDQQFVPHILVLEKGTTVTFPDTDTVRHHVYSFSPAKTFEIRIHKQDIQRNILFEQAGIVELGCNIHDWMLGYLYIAESALFAQTNEKGEVEFADLPYGNYTIKVWHPRIDEQDVGSAEKVNYSADDGDFSVTLNKALLPSFSEFDSVHSLDTY